MEGSWRDNLKGWLRGRRSSPVSQQEKLADLFSQFQRVLRLNNRVLDRIADMGTKLGGGYIFDRHYIETACAELSEMVYRMISALNAMSHNRYPELYDAFRAIDHQIQQELAGRVAIPHAEYVMPYDSLGADFVEVVGGKNANLAEVRNQVGLSTPDGFAITTSAFQDWLESEGLEEEIALVLARWQRGELSPEETARLVRERLLAAPLPRHLEHALRAAAERLVRRLPPPRRRLALRSSAVGEDGELSFAGQFQSLVNLPPEEVPRGYQEVVASLYSPEALVYRRDKGFSEQEVAMAVACQELIPARVSGVMYTQDPRDLQREAMLISAVWGLGGAVVGGEVLADQYLVARHSPYASLGVDIVCKRRRLVPRPRGGTEMVPVPEELQSASCLNPDQVRRLAQVGLMVEKHFKRPQDIEWAIDDQDRLYILQARPLNLGPRMAGLVQDISKVLENYPVIFRHRGSVAQEGIGAGRVFLVRDEADLERFPDQAVLVTRHSSPRLARVMRRAAAVLTDLGSPTGHMATLAREYRVPAIVGTGVATQLLRPGQEVTVDARQNVVYAGLVKELTYYELGEESFAETYEYRLLRRVLRKIAPLNLIDASSPDFTPQACTTFHDITRFVHEKAVQELIHGDFSRLTQAGRARKRLQCGVPLELVLIDLGDGLEPEAVGLVVRPEQVASLPLRAFVEGLGRPGLWSTESVPVDFKSFMSSLTRTFAFNLAGPRYLGQNLAVISRHYANITLRLGYHFTMIDAYITAEANDNHAYFRFLGGVTDLRRRSRRASLLEQVLARNDFRVDVRGDLVVARVKKLSQEQMEARMRLLGYLVAYTRQLDVKMTNDQEVKRAVEEFQRLQEAAERGLNPAV